MARIGCVALVTALASGWATAPAQAIPRFAHQYELACQKCHSVIPRLNPFGQAFMENGYLLPGDVQAGPAFPFSAKINLAYTSEPDPNGLPKAIVDEIEIFLGGKPGPRYNYFIEQYLVDGGQPGSTRDAWLNYRMTPPAARIPAFAQAGAFTLTLPVDPESFRETVQHYTVWDQTVGNNPFKFFDSKIGLQMRAGNTLRGTSVQLSALQGHDVQSGLPTIGVDLMGYAQQSAGPLVVSTYRYTGRRPDDAFVDGFWRQGFGLTYAAGPWECDNVWQTGYDDHYDSFGAATISSGGFTQLRYQFDRRLFALARYEGTNDPTNGFTRDLVALLGYRVSRNSRLTIEDVVTHVPQTKNTLNTQFTVGF